MLHPFHINISVFSGGGQKSRLETRKKSSGLDYDQSRGVHPRYVTRVGCTPFPCPDLADFCPLVQHFMAVDTRSQNIALLSPTCSKAAEASSIQVVYSTRNYTKAFSLLHPAWCEVVQVRPDIYLHLEHSRASVFRSYVANPVALWNPRFRRKDGCRPLNIALQPDGNHPFPCEPRGFHSSTGFAWNRRDDWNEMFIGEGYVCRGTRQRAGNK